MEKIMKKDMPKLTFRPGSPLLKRFRKLCFRLNVSQDGVCIYLIDKWCKENGR